MDKFALVYEFNNDSPLITYKASKELDAGNNKRALGLLKESLEKNPYHSTTYYMLAVALAKNNQIEVAKEFLNKATEMFYDEGTKDYYFNIIEKIRMETEGINLGIEETVNEVLSQSFLEADELNNDIEISEEELKATQTKKSHDDDNSIITETLAEIYASQNNYEEAIEIYEKLLHSKPEKEDKLKKRIAELKEILESKKKRK